MPRFTKQHDRFSCGPAAIANALKWAGEQLSYKSSKKKICLDIDCINPLGTKPTLLEKGLRKLGKKSFNVCRRTKFSLAELDKHLLKQEGSAILRYIWPDTEATGHYVFISEYNHRLFGGMYYITNLYSDGPAGRYIKRDTMKWLLRKRTKAVCWFLYRNNDENSS